MTHYITQEKLLTHNLQHHKCKEQMALLKAKCRGRLTGVILDFTNQHRWLRALGAHFINTPSNLLRWNFQHFPFFGRFQFQMRQMLKKDADGRYINPEAAAEANARMTMGYLIWTAALQQQYTVKQQEAVIEIGNKIKNELILQDGNHILTKVKMVVI